MHKITKRTMAVGLPLAAVAATGVAFAATTALTSGSLGAGDTAVNACQSAATVNYTTAYVASAAKYELDHVNVAFPGTKGECDGFDWKLTVVNDGTNPVSYSSVTGPAITGNALSIDASGSNIPAEDVTHIAFVVSKATS